MADTDTTYTTERKQEREKERKEQLQKLLDSANDGAKGVVAQYVAFLSLAAYLMVAIGATTDEQLLRISPVKLPLLGVELAIIGFYVFAPLLFALFHLDVMLQYTLLARKLWLLDERLVRRADQPLRERLVSHPLVHLIARRQHDALPRWLLSSIAWITLVFLPLALLLWAQLRFLRYHDTYITVAQGAVVLLDALVVTLLWPRVIAAQPAGQWWCSRRAWLGWGWSVVGVLLLALIGAGAASAVLIGSKGLGHRFASLRDSDTGCPLPRAGKTGSQVLPDGWLPQWVLYNWAYLDLRKRVLVENTPAPEVIAALRSNDPKTHKDALNKVSGINLRCRDLRYASLDHALLSKADLRRSDLRGTVLTGAGLGGADLEQAQLQGAKLWGAQLQDADLRWAQLQGAALGCQGTECQNANLEEPFQGAKFWGAQLRGADLGGAQLQGADLRGSQLQGAVLKGAQLQGADLRGAQIGSAAFDGARLDLADLRGVKRARLCKDGFEKLSRDLETQIPDAAIRRRVQDRLWGAVGGLDTLGTVDVDPPSAGPCLMEQGASSVGLHHDGGVSGLGGTPGGVPGAPGLY
jgi:uncharacterized protein YjbI with pentapeptide repeats